MTCVGEFASSGSEKEDLGLLLLDKLAEYVGSYLVKHLDSVTNFICPALLEIDHLDFSNSDRSLLADKLSSRPLLGHAALSSSKWMSLLSPITNYASTCFKRPGSVGH